MAASTRDSARQLTVAAAALIAIGGAVVGSGEVGGTPVSEAAGGALAADATFVAPGGPAFVIWSVLYAGFVALAVWQLLPAQRMNRRLQRTGWLVALSLLLNAIWLAAIQLGWLTASVGIIVALLATLAVIFGRCVQTRPRSATEAVLLDGVMGLYLGWVAVATIANTAAAASAGGAGDLVLGAQVWAIVVLSAAAVIGVTLAVFSGGRLGVSLAIVWGLAWIGYARLETAPESTAVAGAAFAAALVVALGTVLARFGVGRRRALRLAT
ncbi:tryptophan-rich sensory protein [Hoyosella sp. YIM 151337]|uniref:tryptophan-rich sensory protein n=1 Tax=Hoyosella sp. YIM 151337 TaxID=2992742 RepID=UPI002235BABF|nr:tryptophan-rich sensory protein [Hoyosella sp. YIM 151337]MCW4353083.1 tryptophan-rich sensory protein [Hoyosella sp. YIM 151337]